MKKLVFILLLLAAQTIWAQSDDIYLNYQKVDHKKIHFGFTVGFNTMDFKLTSSMTPYVHGTDTTILNPELNNLSPGFHVSVISSLRLTDNLDLRFLPGISLGQRTILFYDQNGVVDKEMEIESTFIDLPFLIKYKATRINNTRPYLIAGFNIRNDMARNKEFNEDKEVYIKLKPFDVYYELGFGIDFYLQYFKFSTEVKYSVGTFNNASPDASEDYPQYANSIEALNSRMFLVSFHFE